MDFVKIPSPKEKFILILIEKMRVKKSVSTVHVSKKKGVANICKKHQRKEKGTNFKWFLKQNSLEIFVMVIVL